MANTAQSFTAGAPGTTAAPSRADILAYAEGRTGELVELACKLIATPSENPVGSQREVVDFVEGYLSEAGAAWEEVGDVPAHPVVAATLGDDPDGFTMVLNGHVDVVPVGDRSQWDFDPFCGEVVDGKVRGRGASDMKAGVAGILWAARVLRESGAHIPGQIRLHIVSDEETTSDGTRWLAAHGYADGADACLVAEPTGRDNIEIGQRGGLKLKVVAHGRSAHGSLAGIKGDNAIVKLAKVLDKFDRLNKIEGHYAESQLHALESSRRLAAAAVDAPNGGDVINHVSANVGVVTGGTRPNMVPDYCEAVVDVRLPLNVSHAEIEEALEAILAETGVEGVEYVYDWSSEANATDEYCPLVQAFKKNAEERWGAEVVPAYQWASSDAREYRALGIPTIQFGPCNLEGIHGYNEDVDVEDVVNAGMIYVASLCDLMGIE